MHSYAYTIFGKDPGDESFSFSWYNIKHDNIIQLSLLISSYILFLILQINCACIVASLFTDIPRSFFNAATTGSVDTKALFPMGYTYQKHCYSEELDKYDAFCTCFWDTSTVAKTSIGRTRRTSSSIFRIRFQEIATLYVTIDTLQIPKYRRRCTCCNSHENNINGV